MSVQVKIFYGTVKIWSITSNLLSQSIGITSKHLSITMQRIAYPSWVSVWVKLNQMSTKSRRGYSKIKSGYGRHLISPSMERFIVLNNRDKEL